MKSLLIFTLIMATATALWITYRPKAPKIPDCVGLELEDSQLELLVKRYKIDQFTDHGKATYTYANQTGTCELHLWGELVDMVVLKLPIDPTLGLSIDVSKLKDDPADNDDADWTLSVDDALNPTELVIRPSAKRWKELDPRPVSYTVQAPHADDPKPIQGRGAYQIAIPTRIQIPRL